MKLNQMWVDDYEYNDVFRLDYFKSKQTKMFNNLKIIICNNKLYSLMSPYNEGLYRRITDKDSIKMFLEGNQDNKELILGLTTILLEN